MKYMLVALVILVACTTTPVECRGTNDRDACIVNLAVERLDGELCSTLDEGARTWCFTDVAAAADDATICERIVDDQSSGFCKRDIYIERQDIEACHTLDTGARNDCFYDIARATDDWLTCLSMEPSERREECIDKISRANDDPYGCLRLDERNPRRQGCIYVTSIRSNTADTCAELEDGSLNHLCFTTIATRVTSIEGCAALPGKYEEFCEGQFA